MQIVAALERGNIASAETLMAARIGSGQSALRIQTPADPLAQLRDALAPIAGGPAGKAQLLRTRNAGKALSADDPSTYPGAPL